MVVILVDTWMHMSRFIGTSNGVTDEILMMFTGGKCPWVDKISILVTVLYAYIRMHTDKYKIHIDSIN